VWVGMIAMAGLAAEMGLLMLHYLDQSDASDDENFQVSVAHRASERIRPMMMTGLTLLFSLLPVMISDGTGSDVMSRIAAPMLGGTLSTLVTVLFVFPALFVVWKIPKSGGNLSEK